MDVLSTFDQAVAVRRQELIEEFQIGDSSPGSETHPPVEPATADAAPVEGDSASPNDSQVESSTDDEPPDSSDSTRPNP
jgi:hypothetical protein